MNKSPLVSIIVVNYNGKNQLEKCLESLVKINYDPFEIILVDNNSTDTSIEYVKNHYPSIIIIKLDKNYGFAEPNNIGAKNAKGDYLLFLNNDTLVDPNFLSELVKIAKKDSSISIFQSLLLKPNGEVDSSGDFIDILGRAYSSKDNTNNVRKILSARGASMMIKKDAFWELGGFDKNYFASFEDVDLGWRAWICGHKVVLVPSSIVFHEGGKTIENISNEIMYHAVKNNLSLRLVNFEFSHAIKSIIKLFFVSVMRKLFGVSVISDPEPTKKPPPSRIILKGSWWILKNLGNILEKRRKLNSKRVHSTSDLLRMGLITEIKKEK